MHILIATPTYGGTGPEYIGAVMRLQAWLLAQGATVGVMHHSMAEVHRSRNLIASLFHERADMTHLLFVDNDMAFEPEVVGALIASDKPLVGCVYPRRSLDLDRLIAAARREDDKGRILAAAMDYVVKTLPGPLDIEDGLCRVQGLGMGLCLIRREVFTGLAATGRLSQDPDYAAGRGLKGPVLGFFDPLPIPTGWQAEDLSFCERWIRDCGGEVWARVDQTVGHVGVMVYRSRFIDALTPGE